MKLYKIIDIHEKDAWSNYPDEKKQLIGMIGTFKEVNLYIRNESKFKNIDKSWKCGYFKRLKIYNFETPFTHYTGKDASPIVFAAVKVKKLS